MCDSDISGAFLYSSPNNSTRDSPPISGSGSKVQRNDSGESISPNSVGLQVKIPTIHGEKELIEAQKIDEQAKAAGLFDPGWDRPGKIIQDIHGKQVNGRSLIVKWSKKHKMSADVTALKHSLSTLLQKKIAPDSRGAMLRLAWVHTQHRRDFFASRLVAVVDVTAEANDFQSLGLGNNVEELKKVTHYDDLTRITIQWNLRDRQRGTRMMISKYWGDDWEQKMRNGDGKMERPMLDPRKSIGLQYLYSFSHLSQAVRNYDNAVEKLNAWALARRMKKVHHSFETGRVSTYGKQSEYLRIEDVKRAVKA